MSFIGRWSPFHKGHIAIIEKKRIENPEKPVLILVRNTTYDDYSAVVRAEIIKDWMINHNIVGTVQIIPDIEGVYWGRKVGYNVEEVQVDADVKNISASAIRESLATNNKKTLDTISTDTARNIVQTRTAQILDNGLVVWLTGCPCSGKTTIANEFTSKVKEAFPLLRLQVLDGDIVRNNPLAQGISFSPRARQRHLRRMGYMAKMFADHGILVVCAFVSPLKRVRDDIRKMVGSDRFIEVYVQAPQNACIERDVKGMYQKAIEGKIKNFTGYSAPYEEPENPELIIETEQESVEESVNKVFEKVFFY